jgi:D-methionine transport system permease protein
VAVAFYARLVEGALHVVDAGGLEAAAAMGATRLRIIGDVLLRESLGGLLRGLTVTAVSLVGYSAMAGIVGDLAIRFGYYRYQTDVMLLTVLLLLNVLVQAVQSVGDRLARKTERL